MTNPIPGLQFLDSQLSMPMMKLPVRSVVIELASGPRVLWSPGSRLTPEQLASAGVVTDLVAPSLLHTAGMKGAAAVHPSARLWGPIGAAKKHPELTWHGVLGQDPWPYESELQRVALDGMPAVRESLFLHVASQTLLATDALFNVEDPKGAGAWIFSTLVGTYKRFAMSRLFAMFIKDRAAFTGSLKRVMDLPFTRLVPSHGVPVEGNVKDRMRATFATRGIVV